MENFFDLLSTLFGMLLCIAPPLVFVGIIIFAFAKFIQGQNNQIKWCENCNSWQQMKRRSGEIAGWDCPKCNWTNQNALGSCPTCGWYERYENRTTSHRGPFKKVDRQDIDLFYGVQTEYWAYEEKIGCPKHGVFTAYIPADVYERSGRNG